MHLLHLKAGQDSLKDRENTALPTEIAQYIQIKKEMPLKQTTVST